MSFTGDPANSVTDRLRLIIGDTDTYEEGLTDEIYQFALDSNDQNESLAALQCLRYLVSKYANLVTEKAGGLFIKESEKFEQYSQLLKALTRDPSLAIIQAGTPYAGGIHVDDIDSSISDPNNNLEKITMSSLNDCYTNDHI